MANSSNLDVKTVGILHVNQLAYLLSSDYMLIDLHCSSGIAGTICIAMHSDIVSLLWHRSDCTCLNRAVARTTSMPLHVGCKIRPVSQSVSQSEILQLGAS